MSFPAKDVNQLFLLASVMVWQVAGAQEAADGGMAEISETGRLSAVWFLDLTVRVTLEFCFLPLSLCLLFLSQWLPS